VKKTCRNNIGFSGERQRGIWIAGGEVGSDSKKVISTYVRQLTFIWRALR
jgi:hypothetical protein